MKTIPIIRSRFPAPRPISAPARTGLRAVGFWRSFLLLSLCLMGLAFGPAPLAAKTALVNGDTVTGGAASQEALVASDQGYTVTVISGATWNTYTSAQFGAYDLLIIGDPTCRTFTATANVAAWAPVVMGTAGGRTLAGNRILVATDPVFHDGGNRNSLRATIIREGIAWAGKQPGTTGLYLDTSCDGNPAPTLAMLAMLSTGSGAWTINTAPPCGGSVSLIASNPAFATLSTASLQGWGCSVHSAYPTFPTDWSALAVATDTPTKPTCGIDPATGRSACGQAYILIAGSAVVVTSGSISITPLDATNPVDTDHTVTAHVTTTAGVPIPNQLVTFTITGVNVGAAGTCSPAGCLTDSNGFVSFTYHGSTVAGDDTIKASFTDATHSLQSATAQKHWIITNNPPVAKCRNVTVSAGATCTAAASIDDGSFDPDAGDTITLSQSPAGPYPLGTTPVTLTVTDSHGVSSSCNATVTVMDTTSPVISDCPANITVNTGPGRATCDQTVSWTPPTAKDNCGLASFEPNITPGSLFPVGMTTVTYVATDTSGNSTPCSFTVTVVDNTPPVAPVLAPVIGECSATVAVPTTTDNCAGIVTGTTGDPLVYSTQGTFTVHWTFNDGNGNSSVANQTVIVKDVTPPVVPVLAAVIGECSAMVPVPTTTDNCVPIVMGTTGDPLVYNTQGTFTVHWTFNDGNGNSSFANQTVIVKDVTPPVVPVLAAVIGECSATVAVPTTTDNCVGIVTGTTGDPLVYNTQGTFTVHWTFDDGNGNSSFANQTVIVKDVTPPVLTVPANIVVNTDPSLCTAKVTFSVSATDNCAGVTAGSVPASGSVFPKGTTTVTVTATDAGGNTVSRTFTVTVNDMERPTITAPPDVCIVSNPGSCSATAVAIGTPITADNCAVAMVVNSHPSTTYPEGQTNVTWTVTDSSGNTATALQKVTVLHSVAVTFLPPLAGQPVGNKIRVGQVVPHKVSLVDCSGITVTSGVTVYLKIQGIESSNNSVFQDVIETANGVGIAGTITGDGIMQVTGPQWHFNVNTSNFSDSNTLAGSRLYRSTVTVIDNATLKVLGTAFINLETSK